MIRPYKKSDKSRLIEIIRLNTPRYFDPNEESDFENYLDSHKNSYFVFEDNKLIIGGGGYHFNPEKHEGHISWDLIDPSFKGKGIGRKLVEHCLNAMGLNPEIHVIIVSTSQHTYKFYEKLGFKIKNIKKDFWGEDLDLYEMEITNS